MFRTMPRSARSSHTARRQRCEVVGAVVDECFERRLVDRAAPPGVDADVDHAAALAPPFVDVAVEQPRTLIDWPLLDVPVVIVAISSIWEVARQDPVVADIDMRLSLVDLGEAGGEVPLGPALGSLTVVDPASVMGAGEQQLAPVQLADECEGSSMCPSATSPSTQTVSSGWMEAFHLSISAWFIAVASANGRPE